MSWFMMPEKKDVRDRFSGGPHGLGDPDDLFLRKVEKDVMIPKKMRDIAKTEKCFKQVEEFTKCCQANHFLMVVRCRPENSALKECLTTWYQDEEFKNRCTKEYLKERSDYRRTGITQKQKERSTRIGSSM